MSTDHCGVVVFRSYLYLNMFFNGYYSETAPKDHLKVKNHPDFKTTIFGAKIFPIENNVLTDSELRPSIFLELRPPNLVPNGLQTSEFRPLDGSKI